MDYTQERESRSSGLPLADQALCRSAGRVPLVEEKDLLEQARVQDATPFDAPKIAAVKLNHRGSRCSFEAVRRADTTDNAVDKSGAL